MRRLLLLSALLPLIAADPSPPSTPPSTVFAVVNGRALTADLFAATLENFPDDVVASIADPLTRARVEDQAITAELLYQEAVRRGLDHSEGSAMRLELARRTALVQQLLRTEVEKSLTDAAVAAWYQAHLDTFRHAEVLARHILVTDKKLATKVVNRLNAGEDFGAVATELSIDKGSVANGGSLGWFASDDMVDAFSAAVFNAPEGTLIGPFQTEYGWHVARVDGRRDLPPLEEVAGQIKSKVQSEAIAGIIDTLKTTAVITRGEVPASSYFSAITVPVPVAPTDLVIGPTNAKYTVVMFSDVQCPHCAVTFAALSKLIVANTDLKLVYKHYPIAAACNPNVEWEGHPNACDAAEVMDCSGDHRGAMLAWMMENQSHLAPADVRAHAASLGVDGKKLAACVTSKPTQANLTRDIDLAVALKVDGTPTLFLLAGGTTGRVSGGAEGVEALLRHLRAGGEL